MSKYRGPVDKVLFHCSGFRVSGFGFQGLEIARDQQLSGFRVSGFQGLEIARDDQSFRVWGFRVWGLGYTGK